MTGLSGLKSILIGISAGVFLILCAEEVIKRLEISATAYWAIAEHLSQASSDPVLRELVADAFSNERISNAEHRDIVDHILDVYGVYTVDIDVPESVVDARASVASLLDGRT